MVINQNCHYCYIPNEICIPDVPSNTFSRCIQCGEKIHIDKETSEFHLMNQRNEKQKSKVRYIEVRGGKGNANLMTWDYSREEGFSVKEQREKRMHEYLNMSLYDCKRGSKQKDEWSNIERGKDIFKLSKKDKGILYGLLGSVGGTIIGTIIYLIIW
jgi:hypothetical protein